jgi:hypothetical protein
MRVYRLRERSRPSDDAAGLGLGAARPMRQPLVPQRGAVQAPPGTAPARWTAHAPRCRRLSRLLHPARREPVHQFGFDGCLGGLSAARNAAGNRAALQVWRCRAPRRCSAKAPGYGAITRVAPLRHLVGCGLSFRRYGFRDLLCYLPDMPAVLRALASAENSIERWGSSSKQHFEQTEKDYISDRQRCRHIGDECQRSHRPGLRSHAPSRSRAPPSALARRLFRLLPKHRSSRQTTMVGGEPRLHGRLFRGGTDGSNPVPSSGESCKPSVPQRWRYKLTVLLRDLY